MKNLILSCFIAFSLMLMLAPSQQLSAQHAIGAKVLFLDHLTPNDNPDDTLGITNGGELVYIRNLNRYLNLAIPLKAAVIDVVDDINNRTILSADLLLQLQLTKPESKVIPYLLAGGGIVYEDFDSSNLQFPFGAGLNFRVGKNSFVNVQGEYRISQAEQRNNLQLGLGYIYQINKTTTDTDKDGINDNKDACPNVPGPQSTNGCPDSDMDGIPDQKDLCPNEAGVAEFSGCPDTDGDGIPDSEDACPEAAGEKETNGCPDADGDGVVDADDQCPDTPGTVNGCPDTDGDGIVDANDKCPNEAGSLQYDGCPIADADGDGVADKDDNCPNTPGRVNGCPDSDMDGIVDKLDKCPNTAGTSSNSGCPEIKKEEKEVLDLAMRAVQFETARATLKSESYNVLDQIADIMRSYPAYHLSIAGHTDNTGRSSTNMRLSEERAQACMSYLRSKGISTSRLSSIGYGETRPIADNSTREGRSLNRRVEFNLFIR